jgi:predicted nucleotidyltransferase
MFTPNHQSILSRILNSLMQEFGDRLISVILFGSRARGDAHEDSDWDLLIIARDLPARPYRRYRFLKTILPYSFDGAISAIAKTPEEFESSLQSLYLDIALDGIILYDFNEYAQRKLAALKGLIRNKGLKREKIGQDLVWSWKEFPGFGWSLEWEEIEQ